MVGHEEEVQHDDEFVRHIMERAKGDIMYVITRLAEVTIRYFQFRARELVRLGIYIRHSYEVEYRDNEVIVVFRIAVPEEVIRKYQEEYGRRAKYVHKLMRSARIRDRHYYSARGVEEELLDSSQKEESG